MREREGLAAIEVERVHDQRVTIERRTAGDMQRCAALEPAAIDWRIVDQRIDVDVVVSPETPAADSETSNKSVPVIHWSPENCLENGLFIVRLLNPWCDTALVHESVCVKLVSTTNVCVPDASSPSPVTWMIAALSIIAPAVIKLVSAPPENSGVAVLPLCR